MLVRRRIQTPSVANGPERGLRGGGRAPGFPSRPAIFSRSVAFFRGLRYGATVTAAFEDLRTRLAEIADLSRASAILGWDQQTIMPPRGAEGRAEVLATLDRVVHERFTSPEVGRLLDQLADFEQSHDYDSFEASLIRVTRRDWEKACRVPADLRAEM